MSLPNDASSPSRRPTLLPAFEPLSSSPTGLPSQRKRKFEQIDRESSTRISYPSPIPTSSTGILPSSPDRHRTRPSLQRSVSALSERAPLGAVPTLELLSNGEPTHMGRSANSSDYQLPSNRFISRVHVRATYHAPSEHRADGEVLVECLGWNGCKVHYQGQVIDLAKGETFKSTEPLLSIMVDVQDTRVMLAWPRRRAESITPPLAHAESPLKRKSLQHDLLASSPPSISHKLRSPVSISPTRNVGETFTTTFVASQGSADSNQVQVYEDAESSDEFLKESTPTPVVQSMHFGTDDAAAAAAPDPALSRQSSSLSEPDELSEHDEENDPIVHSFGPFGDNILSRFSSFRSVTSPARPAKVRRLSENALGLQLSSIVEHAAAPAPATRIYRESPVKNHVINQLAFSRVHSIPLSTIFNNVPVAMKTPHPAGDVVVDSEAGSKPTKMTAADLKTMIDKIPCIGTISREGKDAAGKPLEDEFYYLPEKDEDEGRKEAVSIGKPPLRNVRRQHKQYYWKKPKF